ncbi:MAG: hypothetical protein K9J76_08365, partial [Polaromonas sp.]|nr:hypothetical protein [Polaromonas sp.]
PASAVSFGEMAFVTGSGRVRVPTLAKGSQHNCLSIHGWQKPLWSRQIANLYDSIRCLAVSDFSAAKVGNMIQSK